MEKTVKAEKRIAMIPVCLISSGRSVRKGYSRPELIPLAKSIEKNGILQPLTVRFITRYHFELISGERRLRAAVMAGHTTVPCIIIHCTLRQSYVYSLVENLQRESPGFFESAQAIDILMRKLGFTEEQAASQLGITPQIIRKYAELLSFTKSEKRIIDRSDLTLSQLFYLIGIDDVSSRTFELKKLASISRIQKNTLHKYIIKDMRIFHNTIGHAVEMIRNSGVDVQLEQDRLDGFVEYKIRIPYQ